MYDIVIIGGGACGMTAAIAAKAGAPEKGVLVLEKMDRPLRKLKATGNGRCNMTNLACKNKESVLGFFGELGVITRADSEGRIYPVTEDAGDVVNAILDRAEHLGVQILCGAEVLRLEREQGVFRVVYREGKTEKALCAEQVMLAAGGKAAPKFGTTGDGAILAGRLGHTVSRLAPALTGVVTTEDIAEFSGIRARGEVSLCFRGEVIFREQGEIQFTDYGLSGICVFNMSRYITIPEGCTLRDGFREYEIHIDFLPEIGDLGSILWERTGKPGFQGAKLMRSMVRRPVAEKIWSMAGASVERCGSLLKAFPLHVKSLRGWQYAQVTRGGVCYDEIEPETMASRLVPGLYFGGEVLDFDGQCGGFNLQHAFETGIRAGKGMSR